MKAQLSGSPFWLYAALLRYLCLCHEAESHDEKTPLPLSSVRSFACCRLVQVCWWHQREEWAWREEGGRALLGAFHESSTSEALCRCLCHCHRLPPSSAERVPVRGQFHLAPSVLGQLVLSENRAGPFTYFPLGKMPLTVIYTGWCLAAAENQSNRSFDANRCKVSSVGNTESYRTGDVFLGPCGSGKPAGN